jgi:hypothetical protein
LKRTLIIWHFARRLTRFNIPTGAERVSFLFSSSIVVYLLICAMELETKLKKKVFPRLFGVMSEKVDRRRGRKETKNSNYVGGIKLVPIIYEESRRAFIVTLSQQNKGNNKLMKNYEI